MLSDEYYLTHGDPRISALPLMDNPKTTFGLSAAYFLFVKFIGPNLMKNRQAFELRLLMIIYNLLMVIANSWICWNFATIGWFTTYNWFCEPIDFSDNKDAVKMVFVFWVFYLTKFVEFADTVFFILRKKDKQVTKLHVFHHCEAPIFIWYAAKYGPGGYDVLFPMLNSFVHIWMYLYYGLSSMGPNIQKYLWWKKYLTSLQLLQFTIMLIYTPYLYFFAPVHCKVSTFLLGLNMFEAVVFFVLFCNFYRETYKLKKQRKG